MNPHEMLGRLLKEIREQMRELHPALREIVVREEMRRWYDRPCEGWSHEDLSELSYFLIKSKDKPKEIRASFSKTFLWRLENGIPCNRKLLDTYCYILGVRYRFILESIDDDDDGDDGDDNDDDDDDEI